jgi:DNA polymerase-3 subunit epsilon
MSDTTHTVIGMKPSPADQLALWDVPDWVRVVGVFDLETTGVDVTTDRIVTAHVGLLDGSGSVIRARDWLADPGVEIPEGASAIHGITTAHARARGRHAPEVVAEVVEAVRGLLEAGIPVVAYNAPFDFSLLKYEAQVRGDPSWRHADRRPRPGDRSARGRQGIRPMAPRQAHARDRGGALRGTPGGRTRGGG